VVVALGSVLGTLKDTVDALRADGVPVGVVGITTFRPFPYDALLAAVGGASRVVVVERAFSVGTGGIVTADARAVLGDRELHTVVAGLGGRPVTEASLHRLLSRVDDLEPLTFLDLNTELVES